MCLIRPNHKGFSLISPTGEFIKYSNNIMDIIKHFKYLSEEERNSMKYNTLDPRIVTRK